MMKVTDLPNDLCFSALSETQMDSNGIKTFIWYQDQKQKNTIKIPSAELQKEARWQEKVRKCGNVRQQLSNQQSLTTIDKWCLRPPKESKCIQKNPSDFSQEWDFRICGRSNFSAPLRQNHAHFREDKEHSPCYHNVGGRHGRTLGHQQLHSGHQQFYTGQVINSLISGQIKKRSCERSVTRNRTVLYSVCN